MPLIAPLFLQTDQIDSEISVVNVATSDVQGQVTLRDDAGDVVGTQSMLFPKHSSTVVPMRTLLAKTGSQAHSGSVTLQQDTHIHGLALLAQLSLTLHAGSQPSYLEEEFGMPSEEGSSSMHAVASQTRNLPVIAVSSTINAPQTITASCLGQAPRTVDVAPFGTAVVQACSWHPLADAALNLTSNLLSDSNTSQADYGISLQSDSVPGSFYAFGFALNSGLTQPEMQPVDFYDPVDQISPSTVYVGIPIGSSTLLPAALAPPTVTLANFSAQPRSVQIDVASSGAELPQLRPVSQVTVPPNSTKTVTLSVPGADTLLNTFTLTSNGAPADVEAHLYSPVGYSGQRMELLAKNLGDRHNGGSHPWTTENATRSTLLLYNSTDKPEQVEVRLFDPNSSWQKMHTLAPHETTAISINDVIAQGLADDKGRKLTPGMTSGQVQWSSESGATSLGRLLETNRATMLSRSFSCATYYNLCDVIFGPDNFQNVILFGQAQYYGISGYLCSQFTPTNCGSGTHVSSFTGFNTTWSIENPQYVSQVSSSQTSMTLQGQSAGNFGISAQASYGECVTSPMSGGGTVQVPSSLPIVSTMYDGPNTACTGSSGNGFGRILDVSRQLTDQNGNAITLAGQQIVENVTFASNGLAIPAPSNVNAPTQSGGVIEDQFSFCSLQCPGGSATSVVNQQITDQTSNTSLGTYQITYSCTGISVH